MTFKMMASGGLLLLPVPILLRQLLACQAATLSFNFYATVCYIISSQKWRDTIATLL